MWNPKLMFLLQGLVFFRASIPNQSPPNGKILEMLKEMIVTSHSKNHVVFEFLFHLLSFLVVYLISKCDDHLGNSFLNGPFSGANCETSGVFDGLSRW